METHAVAARTTGRPWMRMNPAAAYMGVSRRHLENLISAREIVASKAGRAVLIHPDDIDAYLHRNRTDAA